MERSQPKSRSRRFMSRFDALELHACVELQGEDGEKFIEQDDESRSPTMFSVYGHLKTGGIQCLEDFDTHKAALTWMKQEATRCRFELGFEDFWEHGPKEQTPSSAPAAPSSRRSR